MASKKNITNIGLEKIKKKLTNTYTCLGKNGESGEVETK